MVEGLERDIEEVEQTVFAGDARADPADLLPAPRGHRLLPRGTPASAGRSITSAAARGQHPLRQYFRDVNDHLKLVNEEVAAQRDLLTTVLEANIAVVSVEQNDVVRKISGWAAIITVPTFIASFYGMNFEHMPELRWEGAYPAVIALMVLSGVLLWRGFKRAEWL